MPALIAGTGLAAFAGAVVAAGALYPGYSHVREEISALAATDSPSAWLMIAGFLALAAGTVAAGITLWVRLRVGIAGRIGAGLVVLAGAGMVVSGLARQSCSDFAGACAAGERAGTLPAQHWIHQFVSLGVYVVLAVAMVVLARGLKRSAMWAHLATPSRVAGLLAFVAIALMVLGDLGDYAGLAQRPLVALIFGWPVLLAALPARV